MRLSHSISILTMLAIGLGPLAGGAQTVFTEDFESPDTPDYQTYFAGEVLVTANNAWSVTMNSIDLFDGVVRSEAAAFDGRQAVDLTGSPNEGVMEADFATIPGLAYDLRFHFARNNFLGSNTGDAEVEVFGSGILLQEFIQHDPVLNAFDEYLEFNGNFLANSTTSTLRFSSLDPGVAGITIDGISVSVASASGVVGPSVIVSIDGIINAHPNPFNPNVSIDYLTTQPGRVDVTIFDMSGRIVRSLVREDLPAGRHSTNWNGTGLNGEGVASGIYLCRLSTVRGISTRTLVLLK